MRVVSPFLPRAYFIYFSIASRRPKFLVVVGHEVGAVSGVGEMRKKDGTNSGTAISGNPASSLIGFSKISSNVRPSALLLSTTKWIAKMISIIIYNQEQKRP